MGHLICGKVMQFLSIFACACPGVADHWYPADLLRRAKINSALDWHHSNLRRGSATFILHTVLAPVLGIAANPLTADEAETLLSASMSNIESIWLTGDGKFLLGGSEPSIADLTMVCEIMELELLDEKDRSRILEPHKKLQEWIENTKNATRPHFDEVHDVLYATKARFEELRLAGASN